MTHSEWIALASRRILRALSRRRYASLRQLESKVSEAGPETMRPSPIHLAEALRQLVDSRRVRPDTPPSPASLTFPTFYTPQDFSETYAPDSERRREVLDLYEIFLRAVHEDRGKTLERAVFKAALQVRQRGQFLTIIGSPERPPDQGLVFNGVQLEKALDLIVVARDGTPIAVEDKNVREWLGPKSLEVWALIGKALRIDALPVLICRKVTFEVYFLFKRIGALAFQMHTQLFPGDFAERLARVQHRDGLGFADIRYGDEPPNRLVHFLSETVPRVLPEKIAAFRRNRELLSEFAIDRLEEDIPGDEREALFRELSRRLSGE